jgi:hypothetical protein
MSKLQRSGKRKRDYEEEEIEMNEMETFNFNPLTSSVPIHHEWIPNIPRSVNRFIARDIELHTLQKRVNELRQHHENKYTSISSDIQDLPLCDHQIEPTRNMRHLWWLFVVNCHGRKDSIECFLQYFSNKWIYQYEIDSRTGEKYIIGVFQADTTRHKRGLRWTDISKEQKATHPFNKTNIYCDLYN